MDSPSASRQPGRTDAPNGRRGDPSGLAGLPTATGPACLLGAAVGVLLRTAAPIGAMPALLAAFGTAVGFLFVAQLIRPYPTRAWLKSLAVVYILSVGAAVAFLALGWLDRFSAFMLAAVALYAAFVLAIWGMRQWFLGWLGALGGLYLLLVVLLLAATALDLQWWRFGELVFTDNILFATKLSLITSASTVLLAMVIGVPLGYLMSRRRFWGHTFIDTLLDIPIVLPPLVIGVTLLIFFNTGPGKWLNDGLKSLMHWVNEGWVWVQLWWTSRPHRFREQGFVFGTAGIVLAQFVVAAAFGIRTIKATFDQIDPRIEAVARTLGASRGQAFFRVTLPMARQGLLAAAVMTWARAIGEFGPVLIFSGTTRQKTEVLPTSIWLEFSVGNIQGALAVAMMMVLLAMATLLVFKKLGGRGALS